jgi:hypothetical protein
MVLVVGMGVAQLAFRQPAQQSPQSRQPAGPEAEEWQEPVRVPIRELKGSGRENEWVVVRGVVARDGDQGRNWVGISEDGRQTQVVLLFTKRDFRRCRAGETVTVEGFHRGCRGGAVELVRCRFRDPEWKPEDGGR